LKKREASLYRYHRQTCRSAAHGVRHVLETGWSLVLGFVISAVLQGAAQVKAAA
jgi:RsiW-degrading membrane proteinase PrsW (M82 family)